MAVPKTRLFISWSGATSRLVAEILRANIIPLVNALEPWTSDEIEKGANWHHRLSQSIQRSQAALLCVTPDNLAAPWLHFEAGALWSLGNVVCPYMFGVPKKALSGTPLSHLQATDAFDEKDVRRLFMQLNTLSGGLLPDSDFERSFRRWFPAVIQELRAVPDNPTIGDLHRAQELAPAARADIFVREHRRPGPESEITEQSTGEEKSYSERSSETSTKTEYLGTPGKDAAGDPVKETTTSTEGKTQSMGDSYRTHVSETDAAEMIDDQSIVPSNVPFRDRQLTRSDYEKVFLKLVSGGRLRVGQDTYVPVGMKGWYHAIFRRERDDQERLLTIDQLLQKMGDWT